jgi:lysophospholipase L1-like esterase
MTMISSQLTDFWLKKKLGISDKCKLFYTFCFILFFLGTGACTSMKSDKKSVIRILTFGDSITEGVGNGVYRFQTFTHYLGKALKEKGFNVVMFREGVSGETTIGALNRIKTDVLLKKPDIVTIMYGTNDAFFDVQIDQNDSTPRTPLAIYTDNMRKMVRVLKENNIKPLLMTPIAMGTFWASDMGIYKNRDINFKLSEYAQAVRKVCREENTPIVDHFALWIEEIKSGNGIDHWLGDGVHPNPAGHRIIAKTILTVILKELLEK